MYLGDDIVIFKDATIKDGDVTYLCEYFPTGRDRVHIDTRSKNFVLEFKNKNNEVIMKVADLLYPQLGNDIVIVAIPSSSITTDSSVSSQDLLADELVKRANVDNKNFVLANKVIWREEEKERASHGGTRENPLRGTVLKDTNLIKGKDVLLLDDITTTGNSLIDGMNILKQKGGAKSVIGFVVGRTISNHSNFFSEDIPLKFGFILDLDQTLFDTSSINKFRKPGYWNKAFEMARKLSPTSEVINMLKALKEYGEKQGVPTDFTIVTTSPRPYAEILANKLGISKIVSYNDADNIINNKKEIKPKTCQYLKAKQLMKIYEKCIVVIGDSDNDIIPAKKLGMTSVRVTWYSDDHSKNSDFVCNTPNELIKMLPQIMEKSNNCIHNVRGW